MMTYEELKIRIRQLEAEIVSLKYKATMNGTSAPKMIIQTNESTHFKHENNIKVIEEKHQEEIREYQEKLINSVKECGLLKETNTKMEKLQSDLAEKLRTYNKEIGEMRSIYDVIKQNLEEEGEMKRKDLQMRLNNSERENKKLKEKIKELIELGEKDNIENVEKIKKLTNSNELLKRVIETKKQEMSILEDEIKRYKGQIDRIDDKKISRSKRVEKEQEETKKLNIELAEKNKFLDKQHKMLSFQIEQLKYYKYLFFTYRSTLNDKDEQLTEKDNEIELLNLKLKELEEIAIDNYNQQSKKINF